MWPTMSSPHRQIINITRKMSTENLSKIYHPSQIGLNTPSSQRVSPCSRNYICPTAVWTLFMTLNPRLSKYSAYLLLSINKDIQWDPAWFNLDKLITKPKGKWTLLGNLPHGKLLEICRRVCRYQRSKLFVTVSIL